MNRTKILWAAAILSAVIFLFLAVRGAQAKTEFSEITPPSQDEPFVPDWAKPAEEVVVDFGDNAALDIRPSSNGFSDVYRPANLTDGDVYTYWEGSGFPGEFELDLEEEKAIRHFVLRLNPNSLWGNRTQNIQFLGSIDNDNWFDILPAADYLFSPRSANTLVLEAPQEINARYIKAIFSSNDRAKSGQLSEFEIYQE